MFCYPITSVIFHISCIFLEFLVLPEFLVFVVVFVFSFPVSNFPCFPLHFSCSWCLLVFLKFPDCFLSFYSISHISNVPFLVVFLPSPFLVLLVMLLVFLVKLVCFMFFKYFSRFPMFSSISYISSVLCDFFVYPAFVIFLVSLWFPSLLSIYHLTCIAPKESMHARWGAFSHTPL